MEITLNLPENIYRNVSSVSKKSKREVVDLIVDVVEEKYSSATFESSLKNFSDEEVLALANLQMPKKQSERHSELLYKNQDGTLTPEEKRELDFFSKFTALLWREKRTEFMKRLSES
ncbi:hypothetical protein BH20ACI1_BH20ACI1_13610 [soil metagenome]